MSYLTLSLYIIAPFDSNIFLNVFKLTREVVKLDVRKYKRR
jgi:hypothetical protein